MITWADIAIVFSGWIITMAVLDAIGSGWRRWRRARRQRRRHAWPYTPRVYEDWDNRLVVPDDVIVEDHRK